MRKLLYVPIIHSAPDLGSLAESIDKKSSEIFGTGRWEIHKRVVSKFWDLISEYFNSLCAGNLKIYQDGLMAGDKMGKKIIEEGARKGSKNYRLILDLVERGAEIRKTEDIALLKEEYARLLSLVQNKSVLEKSVAFSGYKTKQEDLLNKRDMFIGKIINETLRKGELGVLFLGAYHDVSPHLNKDIAVYEVKDREKVKRYFDLLIAQQEGEFNQLAEYLISPINLAL